MQRASLRAAVINILIEWLIMSILGKGLLTLLRIDRMPEPCPLHRLASLVIRRKGFSTIKNWAGTVSVRASPYSTNKSLAQHDFPYK